MYSALSREFPMIIVVPHILIELHYFLLVVVPKSVLSFERTTTRFHGTDFVGKQLLNVYKTI